MWEEAMQRVPRMAGFMSVCLPLSLSARISRKPPVQISRNVTYMLPVAVARSSSGDSVMYFLFCHSLRWRMHSNVAGAMYALRGVQTGRGAAPHRTASRRAAPLSIVRCARSRQAATVTGRSAGRRKHPSLFALFWDVIISYIQWQQIVHCGRSLLSMIALVIILSGLQFCVQCVIGRAIKSVSSFLKFRVKLWIYHPSSEKYLSMHRRIRYMSIVNIPQGRTLLVSK